MKEPSIPANEICRLASLRRLDILDTPCEERFDRITRIARAHFGVAIALVSLVDTDRQWFKSRQGLDATETPRNISFCGHAILSDETFVVDNAAEHPDFADNPLVTGGPCIRFYAGAPLHAPDGQRIGTLCIIDPAPRRLSDEAGAVLRDLADCIESELTLAHVQESERFLIAIADAMPGLVAYWGADLRCRFANQHFQEWFGKTPDAIVGTSMQELMGEKLFALNEPHIRGVLAGERQMFEQTLTKADGSTGHVLAQYIPDVDCHGAITGFFVLVSDVTPLKVAEAELRLAASVFHNTIEGIIVTDARGTIVSVNPAFTEITGYASEEAIGQNPRMLKSHHHDDAFYAAIWQEIATKGRWQGQIWNRRKDGEVFLEWQTITSIPGESGAPAHYVSVFNDITELWRKNEQVRHLAFHDALTDLPNRALLMERLDHMVALAEREQRSLAVMFLDLDGFKKVNDTMGHDVGDDLLRAVAAKLVGLLRHVDTVARLGGDEFVVLLDNPASRDEVTQVAERIIALINEPLEFRGQTARVGTSIGIALHPDHGTAPGQLMKGADTAMYAAKQGGKNTHRYVEG